MLAHLRSGDNIYLVFDGAGAQQCFPMSVASYYGKGRGHDDDVGAQFPKLLVEIWEA